MNAIRNTGTRSTLFGSLKPLYLVLCSGALGEWESYTRGLGSRLMARMGWEGGGLGRAGQGRLEPVPATLYPQGKSLDWCMERR
jgi:G-patch domain